MRELHYIYWILKMWKPPTVIGCYDNSLSNIMKCCLSLILSWSFSTKINAYLDDTYLIWSVQIRHQKSEAPIYSLFDTFWFEISCKVAKIICKNCPDFSSHNTALYHDHIISQTRGLFDLQLLDCEKNLSAPTLGVP